MFVRGLILMILLSGCSVIKNTPKTELIEGFYWQKNHEKIKKEVYINPQSEDLYIYPSQQKKVDTSQYIALLPEMTKLLENQNKIILNRGGLDIDLLTIPLKYRSKRIDVPAQINSFLNGAVYLGYRFDKYIIKYQKTPLHLYKREISHYGFSLGLFSGLGGVFMSPTNTNNILAQEYDGVVWNKGIAGIIAIDKFNLGLALGFDNLLDKNKNIWIYEGKSWLGLAFGLNLN
ncbi:hypothetical protein AD998_17600 [bacterium 336/3]|nr:hypothetical protein AD998_17600 [bacterium 336/3]